MLVSETVPLAQLGEEEITRLFALFSAHYDGADPTQFRVDLAEKQWVLLFRAEEQIIGFSTQRVLATQFEGRPVRALFSGDTVIDRRHWGSQVLMKSWCRFSGRVIAQEPEIPLYWFLLSKGHRTYLYLPLFFRDWFPRRGGAGDPSLEPLLIHLARARYADAYDELTHCIRPVTPHDRLKADLDNTEERHHNLDVAYFRERNPGYTEGVELACIARIAPENLRGTARRELEAGIEEGGIG